MPFYILILADKAGNVKLRGIDVQNKRMNRVKVQPICQSVIWRNVCVGSIQFFYSTSSIFPLLNIAIQVFVEKEETFTNIIFYRPCQGISPD